MNPLPQRTTSPSLEPARTLARPGVGAAIAHPAANAPVAVAAPAKTASAPLRLTIAAMVALGAWSLFGGAAGTDDQHSDYKIHQQISAHQATGGDPAVTASTGAARAAMGALVPGQQPDLDTLMKAVQKDAPAIVQGLQAGGLSLPPMHPRDQALLAQQIAHGDTQFYEMRFYDHCAEDGDWIAVRLDNGMLWGPFMITHAGTTIRVPISSSRPPRIQIIGHIDGGGGITVAAETAGGNWFSGVLAPGQSELMTYHVR